MGTKEVRFSEVMKRFKRLVDGLKADEKEKVTDALKASIGDSKGRFAKLADGRKVHVRPVNLAQLENAVPERMRTDARELNDAANAEGAKRGQLWRVTCLALAVEEHLLGVAPTFPAAGAGDGSVSDEEFGERE